MSSLKRTISLGLALSFVLGVWVIPTTPAGYAMETDLSHMIVQDDELNERQRRLQERQLRRQERREEIREKRKKKREERRLRLQNRRMERLQKMRERREREAQERDIDDRQPDAAPEYSPTGERLRYFPVPKAPEPVEAGEFEGSDSLMDIQEFNSRRLRRR